MLRPNMDLGRHTDLTALGQGALRDSEQASTEGLHGTLGSERIPIEAIRPGSGRRTYAGSVGREEFNSDVEPVVRRRRVRREVVALVVGVIFVAAALLKPWAVGSAGASRHASASGPNGSAESSPSFEPTPTSPSDLFAEYPIAWPLVDWSALNAPDPHVGWGVATATLPHTARWSSGAEQAAPTIGWLASASMPMASTITVPTGLMVFAVAFTWPIGVKVNGISLTYNGPGWLLAGAGPSGSTDVTQLTPLPATLVAEAGAAATPNPLAVQSGNFWIAPVEEAVLPALGPPAMTWRIMPWFWPMGEYGVTFKTSGGDQTMIVRLEPQT